MNARPPQLAAVRAWTLHRRRAGADLRRSRLPALRDGAVRELRFGGTVAVRAVLLCGGGMLRLFELLLVRGLGSEVRPEEVGEELLRLRFSDLPSQSRERWLQVQVDELHAEQERRFDCRAPDYGPACGGCTTCLLRAVETLTSERDQARAALREGAQVCVAKRAST